MQNNYVKVYSVKPNTKGIRIDSIASTTERINQLRKELNLSIKDEVFNSNVRTSFRKLNNKFLSNETAN